MEGGRKTLPMCKIHFGSRRQESYHDGSGDGSDVDSGHVGDSEKL